jgi:hypothetical protein
LLAMPALSSFRHATQARRAKLAYHVGFEQTLGTLPRRPAVLFVRYGPDHSPHISVVRNAPDLERAPVWVVYDRGPTENARLLSYAPGRAAYMYDEQNARVFSYSPTASTALR